MSNATDELLSQARKANREKKRKATRRAESATDLTKAMERCAKHPGLVLVQRQPMTDSEKLRAGDGGLVWDTVYENGEAARAKALAGGRYIENHLCVGLPRFFGERPSHFAQGVEWTDTIDTEQPYRAQAVDSERQALSDAEWQDECARVGAA